jgi:hypothetical protein
MDKKNEISNYRAINRGCLVAFFDCQILQTSMAIYGCKLFSKDERRWIQLPTRETTDDTGTKKFFPIVSFKNKSIAKRFNDAVIEALDEFLATEQPAAGDDSFPELPF